MRRDKSSKSLGKQTPFMTLYKDAAIYHHVIANTEKDLATSVSDRLAYAFLVETESFD